MNTFDLLVEYRLEFLHGLWVTTKMCLLIWSIGIIAGSSLAVAGAKWKKTIGTSSKIASFILGGIPILVFLFWMHYPMQAILNVVIDPFVTAVATFSVVNTFLVADLIRGVLNDFPTQYISAAQAYGLTHRDTILHIQFPMILRQVLPNLLFIQVAMLQATLFASLISVDEIFRIAQRINSHVYRPVEIYTALAVLFLVICLPLHGIAHWMKARYTRSYSEQ